MALPRWKKVSSEVRFQNAWWTYKLDRFVLPTGTAGEYHHVHTEGSAMVVPVTAAGLAWFGMGPTPVKARQAESALVGQALSALDPQAIAELAVADTAPFTDHHASAEYRRTVGKRIFARTLREALDLREAA